MKQLFIILITCLFITSTALCELKEGEKEENLGGICTFTKVMGELNDCLRCHNEKTFGIKEAIPFEHWEIPMPYRCKMLYENGIPVAVLDMHGNIGASEGTAISDFLNYLNSNHKEVRKLIIDIHSGGGSLFGGYQTVGIIKYWQSKGYTIETRINGFAASAAFMIFCAGEPRLVSPQAELMWHELITFSMFDMSGPADKEDQAAVLRHLQDTANNMIADMSNLTKEELDQKIRKKEYWINGLEALELGFATGLMQ